MGLVDLIDEGGDIEEFVVIWGNGYHPVRVRVLGCGEEDELLVAIGPVLAKVEESDGEDEEKGDFES